jgi:predicted 3-demethylubiquinone-9 3-methyltransferase (glyoxalase superfamily)
MTGITTFLTFPGTAAEAAKLYVSIFPDSQIAGVSKAGPDNEPQETLVLTVTISGTEFTFMDMTSHACPPFSWSCSLLYAAASKSEFDVIFGTLKQGGNVMMGPEPMFENGFELVSWVTDKFGVTWQIVLKK